ncbi:hypothetical protein GYB61_00680 [bacterium]|nr:hypothetical protein [bacterium]
MAKIEVQHDEATARWRGLTPGKQYYYRLFVWEQGQQGQREVTGQAVGFNWSLVQDAFDEAGGLVAAASPQGTNFLRFSQDIASFDMSTVASSLKPLYLELHLIAGNHHSVGQPWGAPWALPLDPAQGVLVTIESIYA